MHAFCIEIKFECFMGLRNVALQCLFTSQLLSCSDRNIMSIEIRIRSAN